MPKGENILSQNVGIINGLDNYYYNLTGVQPALSFPTRHTITPLILIQSALPFLNRTSNMRSVGDRPNWQRVN
jgi:hypothetical protein